MNNFDSGFSKKNFIIVFILLVVLGIFLVVTSVADSTQQQNKVSNSENDIELVTDASRFYTVSGCIDKYLLYLSQQDESKLFSLLDSEYITSNNITEDNIFEFLPSLTTDLYTINSRKMYQQQLSDAITKYYVYGFVVKNEFADDALTSNRQEAYYIVTLDASNLTFTIMPYDGKIFK